MHLRKTYPFGWIICVACCVSCATQTKAPHVVKKIPEHQTVVARMETLLQQHRTPPDHLLKTNAVMKADDFDVAKLLEILPNISIEKGYRLDYVHAYRPAPCGGVCRPELYARKAGQEPYKTYVDFWNHSGNAIENAFGYPRFPPWLQHIRSDGSPDGYLQLFTLVELGGRFYDDEGPSSRIVCTPEALSRLLKEWGQDRSVPTNLLVQGWISDPTPVVILDEETATVSVTCADSWDLPGSGSSSSGYFLSRINWTVTRQFPHMAVKAVTSGISVSAKGACSSLPDSELQFFREPDAQDFSTRAEILAREELGRAFSRRESNTTTVYRLEDYKRTLCTSRGKCTVARYFLKEGLGAVGQPRMLTVGLVEQTGEITTECSFKFGEPFPLFR